MLLMRIHIWGGEGRVKEERTGCVKGCVGGGDFKVCQASKEREGRVKGCVREGCVRGCQGGEGVSRGVSGRSVSRGVSRVERVCLGKRLSRGGERGCTYISRYVLKIFLLLL